MSTPAEQARALINAEALLRELADLRSSPPSDWRWSRPLAKRARMVMRHYPGPGALVAVLDTDSATRALLTALRVEIGWLAAQNGRERRRGAVPRG